MLTASEQKPSPADREEVARLAYAYWEDGGCQDGTAEDNWYRAERDIASRRKEAGSETESSLATTSAA